MRCYDEFGEVALDPDFDPRRHRVMNENGGVPREVMTYVILSPQELTFGTSCSVCIPARKKCTCCSGTQTISFMCMQCNGSGVESRFGPERCAICLGAGGIRNHYDQWVTCPRCLGWGAVLVLTGTDACGVCNGRGGTTRACTCCHGGGTVRRFVKRNMSHREPSTVASSL